MTEALALRNETEQFMPVMNIAVASERYSTLVQYVKELLRENTDYGVIPGTNNKKVLLKPGAEKLCTLFGLRKVITYVEKIEDWEGHEHGGEPFFYYLYRYGLFRGDMLIAEGDGSCNSREAKYRWRKSQRACPGCGVEGAIIKGRENYGGGWLCYTKKGGCGAKFNDTDERITSQTVERIANPDIADQVNTLQKMAQKRALIAATLLAVNASDFFTQDIEDFIDVHATENGAEPEHKPEPKESKAKAAKSAKPKSADEAEREQLIQGIVNGVELIRKKDKSFSLAGYVNETYSVQQGIPDLTLDQVRDLAKQISDKLDAVKGAPDQRYAQPDDDIPF